MLQLTDVNTYYGESHILRDVTLGLKKGRVLALLGRNGAGKTTTLRTIMGLTAARRGKVNFEGQEITKRQTHDIAARGIGFIPAGRRLFGDLTVRQNLELGATGIKQSKAPDWTFERVFQVFPKLAVVASREARFLSGGEQQMLKFGRCLLSNPKLLLLDEPSEGLAPAIVHQVMDTITMLRDAGMSMLLCEQNARLALSIADDACIMEKGVIRFAGEAEELRQQPDLHAHLGF